MKAAIEYYRDTDLRKSNRYWLSAPVSFAWVSRDGLPQNGEGSTRDINVSGVYVLADPLPHVGALVQLDILLPNLRDRAPGMHLHGEGRVLRCESRRTSNIERGFAASVQFYPETSDSDLSHFERSGPVVETTIYGHERPTRRVSFATPTFIRKKKYLSLLSLAAQFAFLPCLAAPVCS